MNRVVVLGIGNCLMMDDGIGVYIVEALRSSDATNESGIRYEAGETDFDYCLDVAEESDFLIVIDSAMTGKAPGDVTAFPIGELAATKPGISLHNLHFLDLLKQLDQHKKGILIGIEPHDIQVHWGLSDELTERFDEILLQVREMIEGVKIP